MILRAVDLGPFTESSWLSRSVAFAMCQRRSTVVRGDDWALDKERNIDRRGSPKPKAAAISQWSDVLGVGKHCTKGPRADSSIGEFAKGIKPFRSPPAAYYIRPSTR
jgi:hypothetical protein